MKSIEAVQALAALAQDKRLAIYRLLVQQGPGGMAAGEIAAELDIAAATLSFHLKELGHARLVVARPESRYIYYSADFQTMNELVGFLTETAAAGTLPLAFRDRLLQRSAARRKPPSRERKSGEPNQ